MAIFESTCNAMTSGQMSFVQCEGLLYGNNNYLTFIRENSLQDIRIKNAVLKSTVDVTMFHQM